MDEKAVYREGNEEGLNEDLSAQQNQGVDQNEKGFSEKEVPITAILVIKFGDGRVEAATDLTAIEMERPASLKEIRDMCHSMYLDVQTILTAGAAGEVISRQMAKAAKLAMSQRVVRPTGVVGIGKRS